VRGMAATCPVHVNEPRAGGGQLPLPTHRAGFQRATSGFGTVFGLNRLSKSIRFNTTCLCTKIRFACIFAASQAQRRLALQPARNRPKLRSILPYRYHRSDNAVAAPGPDGDVAQSEEALRLSNLTQNIECAT
jgi:hypothetical protein